MKYYAILPRNGTLVLRETITLPSGEGGGKYTQTAKLGYTGDAFAIKLDKNANQKGATRLYHFLSDNNQPWSKRCDFVVFQRIGQKICVYCIEFKYRHINPETVSAQIEAGEKWVRTLAKALLIYTGHKRTFHLSRFLVTQVDNPSSHARLTNGYLTAQPNIRHISLENLGSGMTLEDLANPFVDQLW